MGKTRLTEVIWKVGSAERHICGGKILPLLAQLHAVAACERKAGAEGDIEAGGADKGVDLDYLAGRECNTLGHNLVDVISDDADIGLAKGLKIAVAGRWATAADREVGYHFLDKTCVGAELGGHLVDGVSFGFGLFRSVFEELEMRLVTFVCARKETVLPT
jgi:hypothetical protein